MRLQGKSILITGAAGGLGLAMARHFTDEGAHLTLIDSDAGRLDQVVASLKTPGTDTPHGLRVDVSVTSEVEAAVEFCESAYGELTGVVNNAAIMHHEDGDAEAVTEEAWNETINTNLKGVWYVCRAALPALRRAGGGSIVNVASLVAIRGSHESQIAYTASKGGVLALTREIAVRYASDRIRANTLCPGILAGGLFDERVMDLDSQQLRLARIPMRRFGDLTEVALAARWLVSDEAGYVTGTDLLVDGGAAAAFLTPKMGPVL